MAPPDKILDLHLSDAKPKRHYTHMKEDKRLPYPIPLTSSSGAIKYPLDDKPGSVVYFNCCINYEERCCEVKDEPSIHALYYHGYFGKGSLSSNAPIFEIISDVVSSAKAKRRRNSSPQRIITSDFNKAFEKAFPGLPPTQSIVDDLYRNSLISSPSPSSSSFNSSQPFSSPSSSKTFPQLTVPLPVHFKEIEQWCSLDNIKEPSDETLRLSLEEAFFLAYALGSIIVNDPQSGRKLNLTEIWNKFCSIHNSSDPRQFACYYAVYHYFRSKGWVVKSGTKFGCDYLLYKEGPAHYHGLFSVTIFAINTNQSFDNVYPSRDWLYHVGWNRLSEGVAKYPVQCFVIVPNHLTEIDFTNPRVIKTFQIETTLLRRFKASQERGTHQDCDV